MFRNPRENARRPPSDRVAPSTGRPPSPPRSGTTTRTTTTNTSASTSPPSSTTTTVAMAAGAKVLPTPRKPAKPQQTMLVPHSFRKGAASGAKSGGTGAKSKAKPNGSILSFFKKSDEPSPASGLFLEARGARAQGGQSKDGEEDGEDLGWDDGDGGEAEAMGAEEEGNRFNEVPGSVKRRKLSVEREVEAGAAGCTPPPPPPGEIPVAEKEDATVAETVKAPAMKNKKKVGPFIEDSDSEDEDGGGPKSAPVPPIRPDNVSTIKGEDAGIDIKKEMEPQTTEDLGSIQPIRQQAPPLLRRASTSFATNEDFEEFEGYDDLEDDDFWEGELSEQRWVREQEQLELAGGVGPGEWDERADGADNMGFDDENGSAPAAGNFSASCPICSISLDGISDQDASVHVNNCLDGKPSPLPKAEAETKPLPSKNDPQDDSPSKRPARPAKPGQKMPFILGKTEPTASSAFSKLMSSHAEDAAWASAAAAENAARGKPAYTRTCPFYKILPGFFICVDAFRYGAVKDCQAYFLSHFHSDHYIGLTASWCHGPIYCSKVTANLVKQQLRVDPKWIVPLDWETKVEVPGTNGVHVTMISANHCPGSSLFLFEKEVGKGKNPKVHRILHCGDFRACKAHIEHPLLRPEVVDAVSGASRQQKLDVCYLDTTYLNPKYAFPKQEEVIKACADMCVSLNKATIDQNDGWETMKRERAGQGMVKFVRKDASPAKEDSSNASPSAPGPRGRLLVVVGTYSIGKENICVGIARALGSKIFAPPGKQRICAALEDPELSALLTRDPRAAQVHMTPLFEIRADTLEDYLKDYRDVFSRAVGFRPSGWNYRPPNSRFVESPSVQTVLHSQNWKSSYSMKELVPQRGSNQRASCFGVPYSEHSSFRELTMFCCALRIDKIIPTVNVGSAKSRERMKAWCEKWAMEKKKNGLFKVDGW